MSTNAYFSPQFISTSLSTVGGIDDSQTTGIKITSVSGVEIAKPGILCLSYANPIVTDNAEWITYTSIDGTNELQGVTRGAEGFSAKAHSNGVTAAFPISKSHINNLNTALIIGGVATNMSEGVLDEDTFATDSATKLATQQSIKAYVDGGWNSVNETWTYASATTITIPAGGASKYAKGDKIKLTQTTVKYFYIVGVADTVLTITGGSDYTLIDATISANYYSHASSPIGFPQWFSWTPVLNNFTLGNGTITGKFCVYSRNVSLRVKLTWGSTTSSSNFNQLTPPVTLTDITSDFGLGNCYIYDNSGASQFTGIVRANSPTILRMSDTWGRDVSETAPMTWAEGDILCISGIFPI